MTDSYTHKTVMLASHEELTQINHNDKTELRERKNCSDKIAGIKK